MEKIKLENVSFSYDGISILNDVNISIKEGEFISVIGSSGCGKSTMLSLLAGLNFPQSGNVFLDNKPINGPGIERGIVFQHYSLFPWMSVHKNIVFGLSQLKNRISKKEMDDIADKYLELVGLTDARHKFPRELSGGMQQRVAIARVFAMNSSVLLMDEPFSAVDAKTRMDLQDSLLQLCNKDADKKTVVFITHDVDEAILLSDRIIVLSANNKTVRKEIIVDYERPRKRSVLAKRGDYLNLRRSLIDLLFDDLMKNDLDEEVV